MLKSKEFVKIYLKRKRALFALTSYRKYVFIHAVADDLTSGYYLDLSNLDKGLRKVVDVPPIMQKKFKMYKEVKRVLLVTHVGPEVITLTNKQAIIAGNAPKKNGKQDAKEGTRRGGDPSSDYFFLDLLVSRKTRTQKQQTTRLCTFRVNEENVISI